MSNTVEQECTCCGFNTDCIDGLCGPCNGFNYQIEKQVKRLQAENKKLQEALKTISKYGKDGICPYGCDCPNIALQVLKG